MATPPILEFQIVDKSVPESEQEAVMKHEEQDLKDWQNAADQPSHRAAVPELCEIDRFDLTVAAVRRVPGIIFIIGLSDGRSIQDVAPAGRFTKILRSA